MEPEISQSPCSFCIKKTTSPAGVWLVVMIKRFTVPE